MPTSESLGVYGRVTVIPAESLLDRDFPRAELTYKFGENKTSHEDQRLLHRLMAWSQRELKLETQAESEFV